MAAIVFAILALSTLCLTEAQTGGFSVELIHRDSVKSPFYNPLQTTSDRFSNALRRSFNRIHRFMPNSVSTTAPEVEVIANEGEYLMNISLGTPSVEFVAIADTGSDLVWTQCKPCTQSFMQEAPVFDPSKSSTYRNVTCSTSQCENLPRTSCSEDNTCLYKMTYSDGSSSKGDLASDTITLASTSGRPMAVPKTVIGCGHNNDVLFSEKTSGVIGLGGGELSLISQLGTSIAGKFSHCFLPIEMYGNSSKMNFGSNAIVSGHGVVSTPIVKKYPDTFYYLTLKAVSVGTKRIKFNGSAFGSESGNIVIDSNTALTLLPSDFYSEIESAMSSQINATKDVDPEGVSLCYETKNHFEIPDVTMHFADADVVLKPLNTFILASQEALCFTFGPEKDDLAIYGSFAQSNFLVGFDTEKQTVSFKPTDCSKN